MSQVKPTPMYQPTPAAPKPKRRVSRQRRERMDRDAEYLAVRDVYLESNPVCSRPGCGRAAVSVHHIVRGTAGRSRSLLNADTYLGVCSDECHDAIEKMTPDAQIKLKQRTVRATIERLRR